MIRSIIRQGERHALDKVKRCVRQLTSPWGRSIDTLVIPRSYQETLESEFSSVQNALDQVDSMWRERDLVILPSHLTAGDCQEIIRLAHGAGFDAIAVPVILQTSELPSYEDCLSLSWDERWTLFNEHSNDPIAVAEALGHDLWVLIAAAIDSR